MLTRFTLLAALWCGTVLAQVGTPVAFRQYCFQCHGQAAVAGLNLEKLSADQMTDPKAMGVSFQHWEKVAAALEEKRMPPAKMKQPSDAERQAAVAWIRTKLADYARRNAGDPGKVTMRRLTSGEYAYTVRDLTGLDFKLDNDFVPDEVGGEGFTNFGDVQFMQDASLERYLGTAKRIADHAVIGAGPLQFFADPGRTGFELSAIHRIRDIYAKYGFRAASGEGGKPFGMERYGQAFFAAWRYQHRVALGEPKITLDQVAVREGLTPRFLQHIWGVLQKTEPTFPTSEVVARWRKLPLPPAVEAARAQSTEIQKFAVEWPRWLLGAGGAAEGGQGDERALVLTEESVNAEKSHSFRGFVRRGRGETTTRLHLLAVSANPNAQNKGYVTWRKMEVRFRDKDRKPSAPAPLAAILDAASLKRLGLDAANPDAPVALKMAAGESLYLDVTTPGDTTFLDFQAEAVVDLATIGDAVIRCTLSDSPELSRGRPVSALLGNAEDAGYKVWKKNVLEFASYVPQISHGEPTPSDRDPIPPPYNTTYNQPERDEYHTRVKYYRDDRFLVEKMLDDATRRQLDHAWADLYASFEYHDAILRFVERKYSVDLHKKSIADLKPAEIEALPTEPRKFVRALRSEYDAVQKMQLAAHAGHLEDLLRFAGRAWRRPLTEVEKDKLRAFYTKSREVSKLDHDKALRAVLTRVLVAPAFLYRLEQPAVSSGVKPLSSWELANRLSYFLWSSAPDDELRRAAAAGELAQTAQVERQVKRMLADPKARRLATEFFGQWLGFYRFDQFRGVDNSRFPEFTDEVKSGMYEEAVSFFEHIVRQDRPVGEILTADYTFLTGPLAKHYGVKKEIASSAPVLVKGAGEFQRGGVLRLGAVLTATSAPLRTSPVKRGDWVLRRLLGTPTPPPPADAGSIPADEKNFGGLSLMEKLTAHQRNPTCAACHSRIDPLGFPLERYDAVGRWRETYTDGKPVHDTAPAADGTKIAGVNGLASYLQANEPQVLRNMTQKLLGYALGRTVLASDQPLVQKLAGQGSALTFSRLATEIATSQQFRYRKEPESPKQERASRHDR